MLWSINLLGVSMSGQIPPVEETSEEKFKRISQWPGVVVHVNPNPRPFVPDPEIRVREGVTVRELLGKDDDDE
jgi:hypothetical protein